MEKYEVGERVWVKIPGEKDGWGDGEVVAVKGKRIEVINYARSGDPEHYKPSHVRKK
jgi:hypothetical protein